METIKTTVAMCFILIVALCLAKYCTKSDKPIIIKESIEYKTGKKDTVLLFDTIYYALKGKGKIVYDTTFVDSTNGVAVIVNPYSSTLDTIIGRDSFKIKYSYPINEFEFAMKRYDSISYIKQVDTIHYKQIQVVTEPTSWFNYIIAGVGGVVVGLVVR